MTIMQIPRTETLPIDENVLIGLKGMFCNQQKKISNRIASRLHLFPTVGLLF